MGRWHYAAVPRRSKCGAPIGLLRPHHAAVQTCGNSDNPRCTQMIQLIQGRPKRAARKWQLRLCINSNRQHGVGICRDGRVFMTRRWREMDSNPQSPVRERFSRLPCLNSPSRCCERDRGFATADRFICPPSTITSAPETQVRMRLSAGGRWIRTIGTPATAELRCGWRPQRCSRRRRSRRPSADFLVPRGHAFGGHTESKNPVEFRPWSYEFDGNRNARAM